MNSIIKKIVLIFIPIYILIIILAVLSIGNISIYKGSSSEAQSILGTIIQSLASMIAIIFSLIIFISEFTIGKYVSKLISYIITNVYNLTFLNLYIITILSSLYTLWMFSSIKWVLYFDVCIILTFICIISTILFFMSFDKQLNPKNIIDNYLDEIIIGNEIQTKKSIIQFQLIFSMILKLIQNNETNEALFGLDNITNKIISHKKIPFFYLNNILPYYERIAILSFDFEPTISESVIREYDKFVSYLENKEPVIFANISSSISSSSYNIAENSKNKMNSKILLSTIFDLICNIYVKKWIYDYGFTTIEELNYLKKINDIRAINKISGSFPDFLATLNVDILISKKKYDAILPFIDVVMSNSNEDYVIINIITLLLSIENSEEKLIIEITKYLKEKLGKINLEYKKNTNSSGYNLSGRDRTFIIESNNDMIEKRVKLLKKYLKIKIKIVTR